MFRLFSEYGKTEGVDFSINRLTLVFRDRGLERRFKNYYFESNLQVGRICHLIAIFFYCLVGIYNAFVLDPSRLFIWLWTTSLVTFIFSAGLISSFFWLTFYTRFWQHLFAIYVLVTGTGFTVVTLTPGTGFPAYNFVGVIFCLFFCYAFIRLTFLWAVGAGNFITFLYIFSIAAVIDPSYNNLSVAAFYMSGVNLLGMMVCYSLELMARRDFMLYGLLKEAENKTRDMNSKLENMVEERTRELEAANQELLIAVERERGLREKLGEEERILQKSLNSLEQAESVAKLGYFEQNWQTDENYCSRGLFNLLGYENSIEPFNYEIFTGYIHEADRERVIEKFELSVKRHEAHITEFRLIQKGGDEIQIRALADNFYDTEGKVLISRGVLQDITERKQTEEAMKNLESQLTQAQKMESVGRLAGGVAHDYNNISSIIIGYTELSMDSIEIDDPLYFNLESILAAAQRASNITRQLLAFARKQAIAPKVIDLNTTVGSMLNILRRLIGEDIELSWLPGDDIWPIKIDPSQVDQILANLCVNARDAIKDVGKVTIETENIILDDHYCENHTGAVTGDFTLLTVSDTGRGMDAETLNNIFEPFFTTKGIGQGTGLGLATVYGIVKQNRGFINVYSEPDIGTTVKIYLPGYKGKSVEGGIERSGEIIKGNGEMILLVEDDQAILELGKRMLENIGYTVMTANTPNEARLIAENFEKNIDLLITDVIMPEMNGRMLSMQLQHLYPDIKTLYMSGYTANVISHHGVLEEGVNFIPKPFSQKELAVKIGKVLGLT